MILRLLLFVLMAMTFTACQQSHNDQAKNPDGEEKAGVEDEETVSDAELMSRQGMGSHSSELQDQRWEVIDHLPDIRLPYTFIYSKDNGMVDTTTLVQWLNGTNTQPEEKRLVGVVRTDSAQYIFWIGASSENSNLWRAYVTVVDEEYPIYSTEIDAAPGDIEACNPSVLKHETVLNERLEYRSLIRMTTTCSTGGEIVSRGRLTKDAVKLLSN